jgi:LacI family transcriptional regulator
LPKKPTIADVARLAQVSPAAVSRWLNGTMQLPEPTGARIRRAVGELGYQPHAQARRLSKGKSEAIGIVLPDLANPFFAFLAAAAERVAVQAGYDVMIWSSRNKIERELACFDRLRAGYVDGLILITNHEDDGRLAERVSQARGRVVLVDEDVRGAEAPRFFVDNEFGGYLATRHLVAQGHRRIVHIGGPQGVMSAIERAQGWRRALAEAGIDPPADWRICSEYEIDAGRADAAKLFNMRPAPTAVFAGSDAIALGVLHAARDHGAAVPSDLSLAGFDGMPIVELLGPPLTSVAQPIDRLGSMGTECLLAMIAGRGDGEMRTIRLPVELVTRGSVAARKDISYSRRRAAALLEEIETGQPARNDDRRE